MSDTPLNDAVTAYVKRDFARFHMPGHKGASPFLEHDNPNTGSPFYSGGLYSYDITEIGGCDSLYEAEDCIKQTERRYTKLYDSVYSIMSAGGSTLCVQTMLSLALKPGETLLCGRGCHTAAINTMSLLDLKPFWIFPETDEKTGLSKDITALQVKAALAENPDVKAVYITSPDYYGVISDIKAISEVCREFYLPLLVDNAHGAFLRFLNPSLHPINLGAAMCGDSLHKSLPVLTGGAMLHIADERYVSDAKRCMSIFGSTSPSYLIMGSIDAALRLLDGDFTERLEATAKRMVRLQELAGQRGFLLPKAKLRDPLRLTLGFSSMGYSGDEFSRLIREGSIEPEMVSGGFCVLMASPYNRDGDFARLERFIKTLPAKKPVEVHTPATVRPSAVMTPREATFSDLIQASPDEAVGKAAGSVVAACPPGIPVVVPGELIDENLAACLKKYGISRLNVVK